MLRAAIEACRMVMATNAATIGQYRGSRGIERIFFTLMMGGRTATAARPSSLHIWRLVPPHSSRMPPHEGLNRTLRRSVIHGGPFRSGASRVSLWGILNLSALSKRVSPASMNARSGTRTPLCPLGRRRTGDLVDGAAADGHQRRVVADKRLR